MSNSMLEALAGGVPVVSTPVSGAVEALSPLPDGGAPGVVLHGCGVEELAGALHALLNDPHRRAAMSDHARQAAKARFDTETMLTRWEAVLSGAGWVTTNVLFSASQSLLSDDEERGPAAVAPSRCRA